MKEETNILFICTQNFDRSPAAQLVAQKEALKYPQYNFNIDSAGLRTTHINNFEGRSRPMIAALRRAGYNPTQNFPKKVSQDLLNKQDAIFCFSNAQYKILAKDYFYLKDKLYLLSQYSEINKEIKAPHKKILKVPSNKISNTLLHLASYASHQDLEGVIDVHSNMIRDLEKQIKISFEKMFG